MIKKGDFIEIEYSGYLDEEAGDSILFDTTIEKDAKEKGIHDEKMKYGPVIICVGEGMMLQGLEDALVGKDVGEHQIKLDAENAFGKKSAKLIQLISTSKFKKQNINPMPGLEVNIDGMMGTVKTVSGGRTIVDFNHPLSGKNVKYLVKVLGKIDDKAKQISSYITTLLRVKEESFVVSADGKNASVEFKKGIQLPHEVITEFEKKLRNITNLEVKITAKQDPEQEQKQEKKLEQKQEQKLEQKQEKKRDPREEQKGKGLSNTEEPEGLKE
ncbi:FKBP-type peptidyl-prolyl cis-trans isomerase [Candidatus Woesearchaeota archaeon]|nr:FKBP-type peptidyl-prolyl cis-trans isomerase [Candidatus Woesearchaeota archaeon]